ncbi:hypothetical protein GEMRC1_007341 [Eukaryota sp. GEM-RC1]
MSVLDDLSSSLHEFEEFVGGSNGPIALENLASVRLPFSPLRRPHKPPSISHSVTSSLYTPHDDPQQVSGSRYHSSNKTILNDITSVSPLLDPSLHTPNLRTMVSQLIPLKIPHHPPPPKSLQQLLLLLRSSRDISSIPPLLHELCRKDFLFHEETSKTQVLESLSDCLTALGSTPQEEYDLEFLTPLHDVIVLLLPLESLAESQRLLRSLLILLESSQFLFGTTATSILSYFLKIFLLFERLGLSILLNLNSSLNSSQFEQAILTSTINCPSIIIPFLNQQLLIPITSQSTSMETKLLSVFALRQLSHHNSQVIPTLSKLLLSKNCSLQRSCIARTLGHVDGGLSHLIEVYKAYPYVAIFEAISLALGDVTGQKEQSKHFDFDLVIAKTNVLKTEGALSIKLIPTDDSDCLLQVGDEESFLKESLNGKRLEISIDQAVFSSELKRLCSITWQQFSLEDICNLEYFDEIQSILIFGLENTAERVRLAALIGLTEFIYNNHHNYDFSSPSKISKLVNDKSTEIRTQLAHSLSKLIPIFSDSNHDIILTKLLGDRFFKVRKAAVFCCETCCDSFQPRTREILFKKLLSILSSRESSKVFVCDAMLSLCGAASLVELLSTYVSRVTLSTNTMVISMLIKCLCKYFHNNPQSFVSEEFENFVNLTYSAFSESPSSTLKLFCFKVLLSLRRALIDSDDVFCLINSELGLPVRLFSKSILPLAYIMIKDGLEESRRLAVDVLTRGGSHGKLLLIEGALRDVSPFVRQLCVETLSCFGPSVLKILLIAMLDNESSVRLAAEKVFLQHSTPSFVAFVYESEVGEVHSVIDSIKNILAESSVSKEVSSVLRILLRFSVDFFEKEGSDSVFE